MTSRDYQRLQEQDARDIEAMAYANRNPLHYSTDTPNCGTGVPCRLCRESARLAVRHYRPIIEARVVAAIQSLYGVHCNLPHPGGDD